MLDNSRGRIACRGLLALMLASIAAGEANALRRDERPGVYLVGPQSGLPMPARLATEIPPAARGE
jgi:hypothetical protein